MYQPPHFREERTEVLHELMRAHPLATLVASGPSGLEANHIPVLVDAGRGAHGVLLAHVARGNPLVGLAADGVDALAIFQGAERYVSPAWYATKQESGKVVPTWNYVVVHAHGRLRLIEDDAWLLAQITALTNRHEQPRQEPWHVDDAPETFIRAQMKGIIGIELEITRLDGKWKVSQNRPEADRTGVVSGLLAEEGGASAMAALVSGRAKPGG
jgi:transcriptional regulator